MVGQVQLAQYFSRFSRWRLFPGQPGEKRRRQVSRDRSDGGEILDARLYCTTVRSIQRLVGRARGETTGDDTWRKGRRVSPFALLTASRPAWGSSSGALGCMIESHRWATDQEREGSSAVVKVIPTNVSHARLSDFHL
mgnify:CR=1 FL=1